MYAARAKVIWSVVAWTIVLAVVFPLIWMIVTSVKPQAEPLQHSAYSGARDHHLRTLLAAADRDPLPPVLPQFDDPVGDDDLVVVSLGTLGAYSLVRFKYRGRETLATLVLFTYLMPSVVLIIPLYLMMVKLGLANTLASLVIAYTTFALPYALWLLRSFMSGIPEDLESAALVDGAGRMGAFFDVILPQALPGVVSTALFTFILCWNEYLFALVLVNSDSVRPLTAGTMNMLITAFNIDWSLLMAASVMMSLPLIVIFTFLQGTLTKGFGTGAVKG